MAHFKTAYSQREIITDVAVKGTKLYTDTKVLSANANAFDERDRGVNSSVILVNDLVKLTPATGALPAYIERVTSLAAATHIVAQSDVTLEKRHIPIERKDYNYYPVVQATATTIVAASPKKKVGLFAITEKDDILLSTGETA